MGVYAARHGVSGANDGGNPAFGRPEAELLDAGREQARQLGVELNNSYGFDVATIPVAVSRMVRTQQTAHEAGFKLIQQYAALDEVSHGLDLDGFNKMKQTRILPAHAMHAAEATLENPPSEGIWICHGLRLAAICQLLNIYQDEENLFQKFCEVRYLPIGD